MHNKNTFTSVTHKAPEKENRLSKFGFDRLKDWRERTWWWTAGRAKEHDRSKIDFICIYADMQ